MKSCDIYTPVTDNNIIEYPLLSMPGVLTNFRDELNFRAARQPRLILYGGFAQFLSSREEGSVERYS